MYSYYGKLCTEVYDFTKPVGHSIDGDIEYYLDRLQTCTGKILEAGVGSGRMYIPLLEAGFQVEGIDYSAEMLASCRNRCEEKNLKPVLYEAAIQQMSLPHRYEAIFISTGSFCLIEDRNDSIQTLQRFYEHLVPGGKVIIDLIIPGHAESGKVYTSTFNLPSGQLITMEDQTIEINKIDQYTVSLLRYEKWFQGKLLHTELQRFSLRWYGIEEFKLVLEKTGFSQITCSADYEYRKQPTKHSQIVTFEAIRQS